MSDQEPVRVYTIAGASEGSVLLDVLRAETDLGAGVLKRAVDAGALWLERGGHERRLRRVKTTLKAGDTLRLFYAPQVLSQSVPPAIELARGPGFGIWYKPAGMFSQGSRWADHCSVTRSVEKQTGTGAYLVHRLDRATTGIMVVATAKRSAANLAAQFEQRETRKLYHAVVEGDFAPTEPRIDQPLDGRNAISRVAKLGYDAVDHRTLVRVAIETGRKHQVRRHLANAGFPLVGDRLYGACDTRSDLQLCAVGLGLRCPSTGRPIHWSLPRSLGLGFVAKDVG